ncbi:DUF4386 domain-containing protein [Paenibacillus sp. A3]|uniref:DUF4386 domain-containing protein n=1 Tax=Paenibacillus sp. A3 TaxID=1337054 RepID=UPI0006D55DB9|nr:DUF4386 domain-containing protein [Paenibacillus sp. A3]
MATSVKERSHERNAAFTAGVSLILMALAAFFSYGFVHGSLVVKGDVGVTFTNIVSSNSLFKAEILGWVLILICDIVVAWALYIFLNKTLSLLGAWLRLTYSVVLGMAILNLIVVLHLSAPGTYLSSFQTEQIQSLMMLFLEAFESIWSIGLIVFGGHLLIVGYVALKSGSIPKVISILLLLAAIGYMVIHHAKSP